MGIKIMAATIKPTIKPDKAEAILEPITNLYFGLFL